MYKRFVIEYANNKLERIYKRDIPEQVKTEQAQKVDRCVFNFENGFITIDECMKTIAEI